MTHAQHTPGPWRILKSNAGMHISGRDPGYIAKVFSGSEITCKFIPEQDANARLIAEAPAMLAALRWAKDAMTPANNSEEIEVCSEIDAILARINGAGA